MSKLRSACAVPVLVFWLSLLALAQEPSLQVTKGLHTEVYDYLTKIARADWTQRATRVAAIHIPAEVEQRQAFIRSKITELLGGFPSRTPLNAKVTGGFSRDGYRVETLVFESRPKFYVTADVYVPTSTQPPFPAVVGVAGHTQTSKAAAFYQHGWISLAKRGFLVIAFDPPGQGERIQYYDPELGRSRVGTATSEHTAVGLQCILTGSNVANYIVWDGMRAIDYLLTRNDVDPKRIAVAGNSGGGMQSAYLAALDTRLAAAAPSCFLTSSEKLWTDFVPQDAEQNIVGFLASGLDIKDFAFAFAPRPFDFLTATRDFFPIAGSRAAYAEARGIYHVMGHPERVNFFEYNDTHGWSQPRREATYRWFQKWLNNRPDDEGVEANFDVEPASRLNATSTGQVATSLGGETVQSLNAALGERLAKERPTLTGDGLQRAIASRIGISIDRKPHVPKMTSFGEIGRDGYRIVKITLETEPGVQVPALVFEPFSARGRKPAVLYLDPDGKSAGAAPGGDIEALVRAGYLVLAPDLRGWGETAALGGHPPHDGRYHLSMRAMLIGRTIIGMQATDLLGTFDYLASRPDVDAGRIGVFSKGNAEVVALLTAALEPRIHQIACEEGPVSYLDIVRARFHDDIADITIPGVLEQFDLPDVAAAIAPRRLWLVDLSLPSGSPEVLGKVTPEYQSAERAYAQLYAQKDFRITTRPEGWAFAKVYGEWLSR